jgi:hypothetical protein
VDVYHGEIKLGYFIDKLELVLQCEDIRFVSRYASFREEVAP